MWSPGDLVGQTSLPTKPQDNRDTTHDHHRNASYRQLTAAESDPTFTKVLTETPRDSTSSLAVNKLSRQQTDGQSESVATIRPPYEEEDETDYTAPSTIDPSIAGSIYRGIDPHNKLPDSSSDIPPLLRRTQSVDQLEPYRHPSRDDNWYPRHLSFSIAEESVLHWKSLVTTALEEEQSTPSLQAAYATQSLISNEAKRLRHKLAVLSALDATWVSARLSTIADLDAAAEADTIQLESLYNPALESYQSLREDAHEIISGNRGVLQDAVRELATLGDKMDYELGSLRGKVDDVEDGVKELERLVEDVEGRVADLESFLGGTEGWGRWMLRMVTGIGV
jgi:hypothetical protein